MQGHKQFTDRVVLHSTGCALAARGVTCPNGLDRGIRWPGASGAGRRPLPSASTAAYTLVVKPPRERPMAAVLFLLSRDFVDLNGR
jgi:hypothetical protein